MMNEEPPYGTVAWFFYEIDERQRQIYELVFDIDQKLAKVKDLLNEIGKAYYRIFSIKYKMR